MFDFRRENLFFHALNDKYFLHTYLNFCAKIRRNSNVDFKYLNFHAKIRRKSNVNFKMFEFSRQNYQL